MIQLLCGFMDYVELGARELIRHTVASYTLAGDGYRLDDLVALFHVDGVLQIDGREPAVGRAAILATLTGSGERVPPAGVPAGTFYVRHFVTNVLIKDVTESTASGSSYFAVLTPAGLDHWGRYRDEYVKVDQTWQFKSRRVRVDARAPGMKSWLDG